MIRVTNKEECCGCFACKQVCPKSCIQMTMDPEGFYYPRIVESECIGCNLCNMVCPYISQVKSKNISNSGEYLLHTYAAYSLNLFRRINSSSGGIFYELASHILEKGGIVFGASFTNNCEKVEIIWIEEENAIQKLSGSKYVQATNDLAFKKIRTELQNGRLVLFSGTPCQTNSLTTYLGKKYDNLYLVDIICHGVPSPGLWGKYIRSISERLNIRPKSCNFRDKRYGWKNFGLKVNGEGRKYYSIKQYDLYTLAFLKNYTLRPSCYSCIFKEDRCADMTLGDFWGIEEVAPELYSEGGVSVVIIRTSKGMELFESIKDRIMFREVSYKEAVKNNPAENSAVSCPLDREKLFEQLEREGVSCALKHFFPMSTKDRIKKKLINAGIWKLFC